MVEIRWTVQAADDLEYATQYIAVDSPHFASLFAIKIVSSIDRLAYFPRLGRVVPEIDRPEIRELLVGSYRVIYRCNTKTVEILTIYHGARLLDPDAII